MFGFLPPSSSDNFLNIGAATLEISAPVFVPPVKEITGIPGCTVMALPTFGPVPCTIFKTPAGSPASIHNSDSIYAVMGVISEGLATTQFPDASAGAIFQVKRYSGRFHGEMHPAIPI